MILNCQLVRYKKRYMYFFLNLGIWGASCRSGGMRVALVTSGGTSGMMDFHHNKRSKKKIPLWIELLYICNSHILSEIKITITLSQILRTLYLSTIRTCLHSLFIRISICFNSGHFLLSKSWPLFAFVPKLFHKHPSLFF